MTVQQWCFNVKLVKLSFYVYLPLRSLSLLLACTSRSLASCWSVFAFFLASATPSAFCVMSFSTVLNLSFSSESSSWTYIQQGYRRFPTQKRLMWKKRFRGWHHHLSELLGELVDALCVFLCAVDANGGVESLFSHQSYIAFQL